MGNICAKCHKLKPDNHSSRCWNCTTNAAPKLTRVKIDFAGRNKAITEKWLSGATIQELANDYSLTVGRVRVVINSVLESVEQYFTTHSRGHRKAADARHGEKGTNIKGETK